MGTSDLPAFLGYGAPDGSWTVDFPAQARAWIRSLAGDTGVNLLITFVDANSQKTRRQERGFHAMIAPWAKERGDNVDDLKQFLLGEVFGHHTYVDRRSGAEVQVLAEPHTSKLTKQQYSHLIERSMDIAAEDNVILIAPDEWRQMKEAERRKLQRAAKKAQP
jgi:hypothetical protein